MIIFFDSAEDAVSALKSTYEEIMPDVIMVHVEYKKEPSIERWLYPGLDVALEQVQLGRPIILVGFDSGNEPNRLTNDPRFKKLLNLRNVAYVQFPWDKGILEETYRQISP